MPKKQKKSNAPMASTGRQSDPGDFDTTDDNAKKPKAPAQAAVKPLPTAKKTEEEDEAASAESDASSDSSSSSSEDLAEEPLRKKKRPLGKTKRLSITSLPREQAEAESFVSLTRSIHSLPLNNSRSSLYFLGRNFKSASTQVWNRISRCKCENRTCDFGNVRLDNWSTGSCIGTGERQRRGRCCIQERREALRCKSDFAGSSFPCWL
jgi:hypothetical protein